MIVARKPCTIYASDLAFCAGLLAVLAGGYLLLVQPAARRSETLRQTQIELADMRHQVEDRRGQISRLRTEIGELQTGVTQRSAEIPAASQADQTIQRVLASAEKFGVEFLQIIPAAPRETPERVTCDVRLRATAPANGVIRWLDTLSRQHPYVSFEHVALRAAHEGHCELQAVLRLHMLPPDSETPAAETKP